MRTDVANLLRVLNQFRQIDLDINVKTAVVFCLVAIEEGVLVGEIANKTGQHQSTASRAVSFLMQHRMVDVKPGVEDRRQKSVYLTAQGRIFMQTIEGLMSKGN